MEKIPLRKPGQDTSIAFHALEEDTMLLSVSTKKVKMKLHLHQVKKKF